LSPPYSNSSLFSRTSINRGGAGGFNKSGGKAYFQFNEACGNLINVATSCCGWCCSFGCTVDHTNLAGVGRCCCGIIAGCYHYTTSNTRSTGPTACFDFIVECPASTVNIWVNIDTAAGLDIMFNTTNFGSGFQGYSTAQSSGNFQWAIKDAIACTWGSVAICCTPFCVGVWSMITLVADECACGGSMKMYQDGCSTPIGTCTCLGVKTDTGNGASHKIGNNSVASVDGYDGRFDETSFWSRALTLCEISDLWNCGCGLDLNA